MADADPYRWVHQDARLDAFCFTAAVGVDRDQVLRAFRGDPDTESRSTFHDAFNGYPGPSYILVDAVPGGLLVAENNGWQGVQEDVSCAASRGGKVAAYYRNVNAVMSFVHAVDGALIAWFDPLLEVVPPELSTQASGLPFADATESASFALLERLTGVRLDSNWLELPHSRFDVPSPF